MKITKNGLKDIIKEELQKVLNENFDGQTGLPVTAKGMAMLQQQGGERFQKTLKIIASSTPEKLMDALLQTKEGSAALRNAKSAAKSGAPGSERAAEYGGGTVSDDPEFEKYVRNKAAMDYVDSRN